MPYRLDATRNASSFPFSVRTFIPISWAVAGISGSGSRRVRESASVGQAVTQRPQPMQFAGVTVDYNALLSLSRGSILTEVVLFWGLFLESIFLF